MRRILFLILCLFIFFGSAYAQRMSDEQVVEYVKQAQAAGKSQKQMTAELLRRGVTREQVLRIKDKYEEHHNVTYTDDALEACVSLTERYVSDRNFPDKALDALDEAGSRVHIANIVVPEEIEKKEKEIDLLTQEKLAAAKSQDFERAAELRDRLRAIEGLTNKQRVIATAFADTDAIGFCRGAKTCFAVLHFVDGSLVGKDVEMMDEPLEDDGEAVSDLVRQYYTAHRGGWPKSVLLPCAIDDREELERLLSEVSGRRMYIDTPQRGERMRLIESAALNAREEIQRRTTAEQRRSKTLEWLQKALELRDFPKRIEAFDISNLGSTGIVAAMTVHINGKPLKRDYRKFRIRGLDAPDDYASMYQAVYRRFSHYKEGDEKFSTLPDLLLIDGGDKHAATAERALRDLGITVPLFGMVKDDRHRTRALIDSAGHETGIKTNQAVFALVGSIQEETHRFAIEYQRSLRNESYASKLDAIPGVGEKRRGDLLKYFKSVKAIREASVEQLALVVPRNTAAAIYAYFRSEESEEKEQ